MVTLPRSPSVVIANMTKDAEPQLAQPDLAAAALLACPPEMVDNTPQPWAKVLPFHLLGLWAQILYDFLTLVPSVQTVCYVLPLV